jgi:inorganic pyrophosphatase
MLAAIRADGSINVMVESPRGAAAKFKYDPELDRITLSRPLPDGLVYPHDWGFVPSTRASDGDPVDAMIVWDGASYPGVVIACRAIGVLKVEQNRKSGPGRERNDRVAVLPLKAPRHEHVTTIFDLPERQRDELERFFLAVVAFEDKDLRLLGWDGPAEAVALIRSSMTGPAHSHS